MPRIMISATGTNCGKTSIVCGLLKILKDRGMNVKAYKCGPDYIDGMFHKEVLGVESSNLDSFFCNKDQLCALLDNDKDLNVIEGGMGFYDGVGFDDKGSCYDISKLTNTPVVLVINCKGMSSSIGATLRGFIEYRQDNQILGAIFNRLSPNLFEGCKEVALSLGIVPLGYIPDIKEGLFDSRYLGLVTPENIDEFNEKIELIAMYMSQYIDVDRLLKVAKCAPNKLVYEKPEVEKKYDCVVAIAKDEAFCFNYDDNVDMLKELGCTVKFFSPLEDSHIPEDADGLILSGGYPELYAKKLSENTELIDDIRLKIQNGMPTIAECGGFMYLHKTIEDEAGRIYPMAGIIDGECSKGKRLNKHFGYITMTASRDNVLCKKGEQFTAHEFHYYNSTNDGHDFKAVKPVGGRNWITGNTTPTFYGGFPHIYFKGNEKVVYQFLDKCSNK